jgi:DNA-binding protein HU-beta
MLGRRRRMNKEQLVEKVADKTGATKKDALEVVNTALDLITGSLKKGEKVTLVGFGTFLVRRRKAREGRNPQTGAKIKIPAKKVPAFTAGKELKSAVK